MRWNARVKLKLFLTSGVTVALVAGFGFWAIDGFRVDPAGPLLLLKLTQPFVAMVLLAGLAAAAGIIGGLLLSRDLPHAGWLAAGLCWLALALRSPSTFSLMIQQPLGQRMGGVYLAFLAELAILAAVTASVKVLADWIDQLLPRAVQPSRTSGHGPQADQAAEIISNFVGTAVLGAVLFMLFVDDSIQRNQTLFAMAAAFFLSALTAHQVFPTRSPIGLAAAPPAVGALAYLAAATMLPHRTFAYEPPFRLAGALPIDYLGLAVPAVMAAYWISQHLLRMRQESARPKSSASAATGGRARQ